MKVLHESCQATSDPFVSTDQEELYLSCATILIAVLSLNTRKFYIPGETQENTKSRHMAIDCGVLIILMYSLLNLKDGSIKEYINEEFFERLDENDLDYHFNNNHVHYDKVKGFVEDSSMK
jgi:hypothetical protein